MPPAGGDGGGGARRRRLSHDGGRQVAPRPSQSLPAHRERVRELLRTALQQRHAPATHRASRCGSTATTRRCPDEVDQGTLTERYTEEALRFLRDASDRPFFLYLAYTMPHRPLYASERFAGKSRRGLYGDAVETIDWSVGEILRALRDAGLDDDTLVLFTSDNGPAISRGLEAGSAGLLRGGKGSSYEGGMREPCIVRWPTRIEPAQVRADVASTLDLFPTLLELAGIAPPPTGSLDGRSIVPLLDGTALDPTVRSTTSRPASSKRCARASGSSARPRPKEADARTRAAIEAFLERTRTEGRSFTAAEVLGAAAIPELYDLDVDPSEHVERRRRASGDRRSPAPADDASCARSVEPGSGVRHRQGRSRDHRAQADRSSNAPRADDAGQRSERRCCDATRRAPKRPSSLHALAALCVGLSRRPRPCSRTSDLARRLGRSSRHRAGARHRGLQVPVRDRVRSRVRGPVPEIRCTS